jgi:hypothetical protein
MAYYTYKTTFKDLPGYFYYGYHKDNGKPYYGSPTTWKHLWEQFEPEVQILQWFDLEEDAQKTEKKLIRYTWNDPKSLNENVGGIFSQESRVRGGTKAGRKTVEEKLGWHALTKEERSEYGKIGAQILMERRLGIHGLSKEERKKYASLNGKKNGPKVGADNVRLQRGFCDPEVRKRKRKPVLCVETGVVYESTMAASKETGISGGNINSCCKGERKMAGGFHWRRLN